MYKVFDTLEEYNQFTDNGANLTSGAIYYVKEDGSTHFQTNNIDGEEKVYDMIDGIPEGYIIPSGNISITENGENINVNEYATASVNVPIPDGYIVPSGNKEITQNGENIDIAQYATASVNVAPNLTTQNITENGTYQPSGNYDGFSSVTVNVAGSGGNEDLINLIERDVTTFNIPSGTTKIGDYAFYYNRDLTSVTIPNSVTRIGDNAFYNCSGLTSINSENEGEAIMPDSLSFIRTNIFNYCELIKMVYLPYNGVVDSDYTNTLFNTDYQNFIVYVPQEKYGNYWQKYYDSRSLILPYPRVESTNHTIQYTINSTGRQHVKVIYSEALKFVEKMTINGTEVENPKKSIQQLVDGENVIKVWLYDSRITNNTLLYGISVNSVEIQNSVTTIGNYIFYDNSALTSINIPNSVTIIGNGAFYYCSGLTSINIPNSVTTIGNNAFYYCRGLTSINIPNSVTTIGNNAFYYCSGLTTVTIPDSITTIGSEVFRKCTGLISINIPNSVTTIGDYAFSDCSGLTSINIPNSVTTIGYYAFKNCRGLTSVTILATTPPTLGGTEAFESNYPIYVPAESVDAYKTATNWSSYADRIQAIPTE